jgi:hypothetical protein
VFRLLLTVLTWALLFSGGCDRTVKVQSPQTRDTALSNTDPTITPSPETLTLTNEYPTRSFPVDPDLLAQPPAILELSVTKVVNSALTSVAVFVYLSPIADKGKPEPEKILVGNFSLYPPDRPGKFLLPVSTAFRRLNGGHGVSKSNRVRLVLEMKRLDETSPWTPIALTISQPKWRAAEK